MYCGVKLFHGSNSIKVATDKASSIPLPEYILANCPSLDGSKTTYYPTPYLFNGHLQTGYASIYKEKSQHFTYEREILPLEDGGQVSLDWTITESKPKKDQDNTPILVVLHGLTGGSHESYVHGLLEKIIQPPYNLRGVVMNARGCGDTEVMTPRLFTGAWTSDIRYALHHIKKHLAPGTPMIGIGFSLGSNVLVKYLGEEKENTPLHAAISVGNPFDFLASNMSLEASYFRRNIYSKTMANSLKRLYERHPIMKKHPDVDPEKVYAANTIREFDIACTSKVFGYTTVNNYYRDASSSRFIEHVRIPLLCVNALDDPISPLTSIPWDEISINPYAVLATTDYGGHLGWFTGTLSPSRWIDQPLAEFVYAMTKVKSDKNQ
ncbi:Alpha/Beta hydrolase protein [Cunninghamella echinulata]|nr:Alpha/Beta hydrolase protein [Cunninghamella echinulata]